MKHKWHLPGETVAQYHALVAAGVKPATVCPDEVYELLRKALNCYEEAEGKVPEDEGDILLFIVGHLLRETYGADAPEERTNPRIAFIKMCEEETE